MKIRLIFHCGLHKTASSSIQKSLFDNKDDLEKLQIFYPTIDNLKQQHFICDLQDKKNEELLRQIENRLLKINTLIISTEAASSKCVEKFYALLKSNFPQVSFLIDINVYLRLPCSYYESLFIQQMKLNGSVAKPSDFYKRVGFKIIRSVKGFEKLKSYGNIELNFYGFEQIMVNHQSVVRHFFEHVLGIGADRYVLSEKQNISSNYEFAKLIFGSGLWNKDQRKIISFEVSRLTKEFSFLAKKTDKVISTNPGFLIRLCWFLETILLKRYISVGISDFIHLANRGKRAQMTSEEYKLIKEFCVKRDFIISEIL